ncbi:MAG: ABC transporter ATP-binding protein [Candidatus Competibacter sp.]|nr:ABC transporter ATP-binding protein [Candidatus Competibacter sp.]
MSKEYVIGRRERGRETFREMVTSSLAAPFRRLRKLGSEAAPEERFWALRDVSFEVQRGEVVGIIGRNGAGKSTLLKILSRITDLTEGEVEIRGRVASLLEVGTGFHAELTGRENIYLNGAILGMSRREIDRKFDEIVDFSGVEKFIDTPVKRYSSGMAVRLAFAVAAHLEPEILVIDEVLAVGDIEFQKKCLGKMDDVARSGRTILFVSHNMAAIESLCTRAILLKEGCLKTEGGVDEVIQQYSSETVDASGDVDARLHPSRVAGAKPIITRFQIVDAKGRFASQIGLGEEVSFLIHLSTSQLISGLNAGIHIYNGFGQRVTTLHTNYQANVSLEVRDRGILCCTVKTCDLMPGQYRIVLGLVSGNDLVDRIDPVTTFEVLPRDIFGTGKLPPGRDGVFISRGYWQFQQSLGAKTKILGIEL